MSIFAISDLHLSLLTNKPMDIFGGNWNGYVEKIRYSWGNIVTKDDFVIIAGDTSWATYIDQAIKDFEFIHSLPGTKLLSRGNHDYWWGTLRKMQQFLKQNNIDSIKFIHNNSYKVGNYIFCGTRGWKTPRDENFSEQDSKIYQRELTRLELSLQSISTIGSPENSIVVMLHYPPFTPNGDSSGFIDLMVQYKVSKCIYGHLHGDGHKTAVVGSINDIDFLLTSADFLKFSPVKI